MIRPHDQLAPCDLVPEVPDHLLNSHFLIGVCASPPFVCKKNALTRIPVVATELLQCCPSPVVRKGQLSGLDYQLFGLVETLLEIFLRPDIARKLHSGFLQRCSHCQEDSLPKVCVFASFPDHISGDIWNDYFTDFKTC